MPALPLLVPARVGFRFASTTGEETKVTSRHLSRHQWLIFGAVLLGHLVPGAIAAQVRFDVGPYVGLYAPTGSFPSAPFPGPFELPPARSRQGTAVAVGAQGTLWFVSRIGLSVQWGTTSSVVRTREEFGSQDAEQSARVSAGALQLLVPLEVPSLQGRVYVGAGVGLVRRSGDFYEAYERPSNVAGVLGLGSDFALVRHAHLTLGFQSYLYSLRLRQEGGPTFDSGFQADMLARVGFMLELGS